MPPDLANIRVTVIEGQPYWLSKKRGSGLQQFVLDCTVNAKHRVCVVLQSHGRRLYTSFVDAGHFWNYYVSFKGKRCFYWINRSFGISKEVSLLHLDIEWYTQCQDPDAERKIVT